MKRTLLISVFTAASMLAGCAGSKQAAMAPHPLAGAWNYTIDSPEGVFTGIFTFSEADEMLEGSIAGSEQPDLSSPLQDVAYDSETSSATFKFDSGQYGMMVVKMTLAGDALNGQMTVTEYGVDVPITAERTE